MIKNIPYFPETNGIEMYWARAKVVFRRTGTEVLLRGEKRDLFKEAKDAVDSVTDAEA